MMAGDIFGCLKDDKDGLKMKFI